jgi:hypothetical protein
MVLAIDGHLIHALTFTWSNVMVFERLANLTSFHFQSWPTIAHF